MREGKLVDSTNGEKVGNKHEKSKEQELDWIHATRLSNILNYQRGCVIFKITRLTVGVQSFYRKCSHMVSQTQRKGME